MPAATLLLLAAALAGDVYINGVRADGLRDQVFKNVSIHIDAGGDIHIDAPNYIVRTVDPSTAAPPQPVPDSVIVAAGRHWLVTEDHQSRGQIIEVFINGALVRRINSGDPQLILDVAPWLSPGVNNITFSALPGSQPAGGALHVYLGGGHNDAGVIRLQDPDIDFVRRSSDSASGGMKDFTYTVR